MFLPTKDEAKNFAAVLGVMIYVSHIRLSQYLLIHTTVCNHKNIIYVRYRKNKNYNNFRMFTYSFTILSSTFVQLSKIFH